MILTSTFSCHRDSVLVDHRLIFVLTVSRMTRLAYTADWLDPAHDYTYTFTLHYYVDDGDVELVRGA